MTVTRQRQIHLAVSADPARSAIDATLASRREYRVIEREPNRWVVKLRPRGGPLILSTRLEISVEAVGTDAVVLLRTISQPWIFGDIFRVYNAYLDGITTRIEHEVERSRTS
jgi:hypothetical protein